MSNPADLRERKCVKCSLKMKHVTGKIREIQSDELADEIAISLNKDASVGDFICKKCFDKTRISSYQKNSSNVSATVAPNPCNQTQSQESSQSKSGSGSEPSSQQYSSGNDPSVRYPERPKIEKETVELPFRRPVSTHAVCFICKKTKNIVLVPFSARHHIFTEKQILIPEGNRCCPYHLNIKKKFFEQEIKNMRIVSTTSSVSVPDISKLMTSMSISSDQELLDRIGDYSLSEERLKAFTGFSWEDVLEIQDMLTSLRNSSGRDILQALVTFLFKLRSANSNNLIASILGLERPQLVSDYCASVLRSFVRDVLPSNFGLDAMNREDLLKNHTTALVRKLHNLSEEQLVLILDATYLSHQKSSNNDFQKKSYSGQKKEHLSKPMTICTTDGFVAGLEGLYEAKLNDAQITKKIMAEVPGFMKLLKPGDVIIVDRGFRDVVKDLEEEGFIVLMPALKGQRKQLTTLESNQTRLVTMIRFVVEAVHGIVAQKFKLLHHQLDNKLLDDAMDYCKVANFLVNKFCKRIVSHKDIMEDVLSRVESERNTTINILGDEVETGKWGRRKSKFQPLTDKDINDFPEWTERQLKIFFTGTYQYHQSVSYLADIIDEKGTMDLQFLKDSKGTSKVLKIQVKSRHISSKTYNCYIQYKQFTDSLKGIEGRYCECGNGSRTIGCCSHVAAVIYYLSYARYKEKIVRPAEKLSSIFQQGDIMPVINEDSDEED